MLEVDQQLVVRMVDMVQAPAVVEELAAKVRMP